VCGHEHIWMKLYEAFYIVHSRQVFWVNLLNPFRIFYVNEVGFLGFLPSIYFSRAFSSS
jgi:hypothetical protein